MGFFYTAEKPQRLSQPLATKTKIELLHKAECNACPLYRIPDVHTPSMKPHGTTKPVVYILGEAPGENEDKRGRPFVGKSGKALRLRIPRGWDDTNLRWSNCVRTRPPDNRTPTFVEIECCRPSITRDIEAAQPRAIFGFGAVPLQWAINQTGITKWTGRRVPIKVGNHTCWFFPMMHPSYILHTRKFEPRDANGYGSEIEFQFAKDIERAFAAIDNLPEPIVHTKEDALADIECIDGSGGHRDLERFEELLDAVWNAKYAGFDYEANALRPYGDGAKLLSAALSTKKHTFSIALRHRQAGWSPSLLERVEGALEEFLHDAPARKVSHQLAYEQEWSGFFFGKDCLHGSGWEDTVSQAYVLDERMKMGKPDAHSLEVLTLQYFGLNIKALNSVSTKNLDEAPIGDVLQYNGLDARYHHLLFHEQDARLEEEGLQDVYRHHLTRIPTSVLTQMKGVPVDQTVVETFYKRYNSELVKVEDEIDAHPAAAKFKRRYTHEYRPSADADVMKMFAQIIGFPIASANENAIKVVDHPMAGLTLKWRKAAKNLSTYVEPIRIGSPHIYPDGLLHPILSTTRTRTSRTSSEDPNIQNYPKRKTREVRSQIKPADDERVVSFDYGQIQARNVGMESKDEALVQAFWDRYDIHTDWVERIVKLYPKWIKEGVPKLRADKKLFKSYRDRSKNELVFPSFFGARAKSVAGYLEIPERIADELHEQFWDKFPHIKDWHERIQRDYYETGYVTGLSGYRRRAPISPNELINAPIQADEAMIVCDAQYRLSKVDHDKLQASMMVHDDLTFIWKAKDIDTLAPLVIKEMVTCPFEWAHNVPILVEMSVGRDWAKQEEVGAFASDTWDGTFKQESKS